MTEWADDGDEEEQEEREPNRLREQMLEMSAGDLTALANALKDVVAGRNRPRSLEQVCRDSILPETIMLLRQKGWLVMGQETVQ